MVRSLMIDAPKEIPIVRSNIEENPERRRETYYPEEKISAEAQKKIQRILGKSVIRVRRKIRNSIW